VSDICSVDSRSTYKKGRPRSSSQPTENNDKMIKEPFNPPKSRHKGRIFMIDHAYLSHPVPLPDRRFYFCLETPLKRIETMSNNSNILVKPAISVDGISADEGFRLKRSENKNYK
jgi:hypothetical protein